MRNDNGWYYGRAINCIVCFRTSSFPVSVPSTSKFGETIRTGRVEGVAVVVRGRGVAGWGEESHIFTVG